MIQKYSSNDNTGIVSEKEYIGKTIIGHNDFDLFDDTLDKVERVIIIRRTGSVDRNEKWKILQDNKLVLTISADKLSNKQKEFLRTPQGFNFLISQFKNEVKSFNKIKMELKKII